VRTDLFSTLCLGQAQNLLDELALGRILGQGKKGGNFSGSQSKLIFVQLS